MGDCYFLAALASLSEVPGRIEKLFVNKKINKSGIYCINFYINGEQTPVIVDDFIWSRSYPDAVMAQLHDSKLWVALLEKAWAKLHGSFARVYGDYTTNAFQILTGLPAYSMFHGKNTTEDLWNRLQRSDSKNYCMQASSNSGSDTKIVNGIAQGHAYSIISVHVIQHEGEEVRLLKIRNPWHRGEWTGLWSDESEIWTDETKE